MSEVINIENLHKSFDDIKAVNGISLNVKAGEMFGLVGPDGAGKTTTIRVMCGLLHPDNGDVNILGSDVTKNRKEVQNQIGYLSQKFSLYGDLSVDENIEFFADIHGVKDYNQRRNELLAFTRLTPFRDRLAEKLSGGMKQKLALTCSLIHKPKILFLDEPTTGVDPVSRRDFWKILSDLQKNGITIFMTTPYLDEAERCNRVAMMHLGKIISLDTPAIIKTSIKRKTMEIMCSDIKRAYDALRNEQEIEAQIFGDRINIMIQDYEKEFPNIEQILHVKNIVINNKRIIPPSLENVFIHLVKKETFKETEVGSHSKKEKIMKQFIIMILLFSANVTAQDKILTLEESVQTGLRGSKDLTISKSKMRFAAARITEVSSQMYPQLKFSASYVRLSDVPPFEVAVPFSPSPIRIQDVILDNYNLKLSLQQPLFTGFRLSSLKSAADYNFNASEYEYDAAVNDYAVQIHEAFWNFYNSEKFVQLMEEQLVSLENHLADTKNFLENGLATMNDVLKLEVQHSNLELKLIEAENNLDLARINFNRIIGYDLNSQTELSVPSINPVPEEFVVDELIIEAKRNRKELKSLENRVLANDESISAANAGWFPSVYLFGNVYHNRPHQRIMPARDEFRETWDVGVSLSWDLWNWGYTSSQTTQAQELKLQTETTLSQSEDIIEIEVNKEFLNFNKSLKKIEVARKNVEQSKENYRLTKEKYDYQLAGSSELIDAQTSMLEAETNLISALVSFQISKVRLEKAVGRKVY